MLPALIEWRWKCGWWLSVLGPISTSIDMFTKNLPSHSQNIFIVLFFMKNVAFKFLAPIHQGFCCCGNWVKIWPCRCPGAPQMSSEVRILSNNCQHFIKIWLFLPNPRAKWNSLSPACLNGHETHGGVSKDNNNQEVDCDLIFNAKPRQHYYTNWKLCECVCLSSSSLSPLFDDRTSREAGLKFQC